MRDTPKTEPGRKAPKPTDAMAREDRLKAALKANMARRKAQAKARAAGGTAGQDDADNDNKMDE